MTVKCIIQAGKVPGEAASLLEGERELIVLYDENVAWVAGEVLKALPGVKASIALKTSEPLKTLETVQRVERELLEAGTSRGALLLCVGGGITTDIGGFAASIYKRGIRYANLPTTLLAQVDAAIGGKTGVNLDGYKNMLGAFHMPEFTFLCADVLRTLPRREFLSGMAEMLKSFLIADGEVYGDAVRFFAGAQNDSGVLQNDSDVLLSLVKRAATIKETIVLRDPYEQGERAKLNLGHTFGHAIEHEARLHSHDITHGEAVAMGIILAARLGESLGISEPGLAGRLSDDWRRVGLPTDCPYPLEALQEAMARDKKALGGGKVKLVLPVTPGKLVFHEMNPYDLHIDTK